MRAIKLPSGIMVKQTITVRTKTYRHILICYQAICYGVMSKTGTKDISFNQSPVSDERCNVIISHPATDDCSLGYLIVAALLCLLLFIETAMTHTSNFWRRVRKAKS